MSMPALGSSLMRMEELIWEMLRRIRSQFGTQVLPLAASAQDVATERPPRNSVN